MTPVTINWKVMFQYIHVKYKYLVHTSRVGVFYNYPGFSVGAIQSYPQGARFTLVEGHVETSIDFII